MNKHPEINGIYLYKDEAARVRPRLLLLKKEDYAYKKAAAACIRELKQALEG